MTETDPAKMPIIYRQLDGYSLHRFGSDGSAWRHYAGSPGRKSRPPKWKPLRPSRKQTVTITSDAGETTTTTVASLILRAFVGPRPLGCEPLHYPDPDPANNALDNLRWAPRGSSKVGDPRLSEASRRKRVANRAFSDPEVAAILDMAVRGMTAVEIAEREGVSRRTIDQILSGRSYRHVPRPDGLPDGRRDAKGEAHPKAVLTRARAGKAKRLKAKGYSGREIARMLGLKYSTVRRVLDGSAWADTT